MLEYALAIAVGAWASWQDLKEKSIDMKVIAGLGLIIIIGIYTHGLVGLRALAEGLAIGLAMQILTGWQVGDTIILAAFSALTLRPLAITVAAVSTSFFFALAEAREKGETGTIPFAPFLLLGTLITIAWG